MPWPDCQACQRLDSSKTPFLCPGHRPWLGTEEGEAVPGLVEVRIRLGEAGQRQRIGFQLKRIDAAILSGRRRSG